MGDLQPTLLRRRRQAMHALLMFVRGDDCVVIRELSSGVLCVEEGVTDSFPGMALGKIALVRRISLDIFRPCGLSRGDLPRAQPSANS